MCRNKKAYHKKKERVYKIKETAALILNQIL